MRIIVSTVLLSLLQSTAVAEEIPGTAFAYGNWTGAAYTFDDTKAFSHCAVSAEYLSGDTLLFSVNQDITVSVGVISRSFNLSAGQVIPVSLRVDGRRPFYAQAEALDSSFVALRLEDFDSAMVALQGGQTLYLDSGFGSGVYDLTGSRRALQRALDCAAENYRYVGIPQPVTPTHNSSGTDRTLLYQVATDMISQLGVTDATYLTAAEVRELQLDESVVWESSSAGVLGGVLLIPFAPDQPLQASDASDITFVGGRCDGELATTSRAVPIPDLEARQVRSLCVNGGKEVETLVTKIRFGSELLYTFLAFSKPGTGGEDRRKFSDDFALRTASFLQQ